jgi:hypothetical protein
VKSLPVSCHVGTGHKISRSLAARNVRIPTDQHKASRYPDCAIQAPVKLGIMHNFYVKLNLSYS